jgi:bifunctional non-homologous end joining protein LigD
VIDPQSGVTKGELADYVRAVAPLMLPWAANRPLSLVRCPQGRAKKCFFQKHSTGTFGPDVHQIDIEEKKGEVVDYVYVKDQAGLMSCVQMGTIEFHGWGSSTGDIEKPDRLVFDIDPDEGLGFEHVRKAARDLKDHLADMGLQTFPMLTGGKGIHVIVPLTTAGRMADSQGFRPALLRRPGDGRAGPLHGQSGQGAAQGPHVSRLSAQPARGDGDPALFRPIARECAGCCADRWDELDGFESGAHLRFEMPNCC